MTSSSILLLSPVSFAPRLPTCLGRGRQIGASREGSPGTFADKFNGMPKYVVSKTLKEASWSNTTILSGDLAEEVSRLRDAPGGEIVVHGSAQLVQELLEKDLIDELPTGQADGAETG